MKKQQYARVTKVTGNSHVEENGLYPIVSQDSDIVEVIGENGYRVWLKKGTFTKEREPATNEVTTNDTTTPVRKVTTKRTRG